MNNMKMDCSSDFESSSTVNNNNSSNMNATWGATAIHSSFMVSTPIEPLPADMKIRKSISDSCIQRGLPASYHNKNMNYMLISRSGGRTVKEMIATINERSEQMQAGVAGVEPPTAEVSILAHFAPDAYYRVVISGKQGLQAITRAMLVFQNCRELQECACLALGNLCTQNNNMAVAEQAGAVPAIIAAMRAHSSSVAVQSAACDALRNLSAVVLASAKNPSSPIASELTSALAQTSTMYLLPSHRQIADALLNLLQQAATNRI